MSDKQCALELKTYLNESRGKVTWVDFFCPGNIGKRQASSPSNICTGWLGMIVEMACL